MGYVENNLLSGERVLVKAKMHWGVFLPGAVVTIIGFIITIGNGEARGIGNLILAGGVLLLGYEWIVFVTTELAVTSNRVIAKLGVIKRDTLELNLTKVESLQVQQGIFGRLLDFGTVIVRGTGGTPTPIPSISKPLEFRRVALQAIDAGPITRVAAG